MNGLETAEGAGALDPHEHVALILYTVANREVMLECDPAEIERFYGEVTQPDNLANGGAGLTITNTNGDVITVMAGLDMLQRVTRGTLTEANAKAAADLERRQAREHVIASQLSGRRGGGGLIRPGR